MEILNEETKGLKGFDRQNKRAAFALNINVDSIDSPKDKLPPLGQSI